MLLPFLMALAIAQDCPEPSILIREASDHLLLLEEARAHAALEQVSASFACRPIDAQNLATYWLIEAALRYTAGDEAGTHAAFRAAHAVAPDEWLTDLGPELRSIYDEQTRDPGARGTLSVQGATGYAVRVDGKVRQEPIELAAGEHLLQITDGASVVHHRMVVIVGGQGTTVDPGLPDKSTPRPSSGPSLGLQLHSGVGMAVAWGDEVVATEATEPATKISLPLEAGLIGRLGPGWVRLHAGYAPMLDGALLYSSGDRIATAAAFVDLAATAGVTVASVDIGAMAALTVPSRQSLRLSVARPVAGPLGAELRGGVNVHPSRPVEPAAHLLIVVRPTLR